MRIESYLHHHHHNRLIIIILYLVVAHPLPLFAPMPITLKSNATAEDVKAVVEEENAVIEELASKDVDEVPAEGESELPTQFSFITESAKPEDEDEQFNGKAVDYGCWRDVVDAPVNICNCRLEQT